ncbi:divergent protein kinase domain 1C-like [Babylonia areolata]|uniref:divergent protein kinase domain 1C-like n=1 Tax=Babylonia areolata TaxID=304850 RepID=UPI003FD5B28A
MLRFVTWCRMRRWFRSGRRYRCGPTVFFCSVAVVSFLLAGLSLAYTFRHQLFEMFVKCEDLESLTYITDYCQAYRDGLITGSLCQPLCDSRQVRFSECTDFHAGKRVSIMSCSDFCVPGQSVAAILKFPNANSSTVLSNHPESFPYDQETADFHQHMGEVIHNMLKWELGFVPFPSKTNLTRLMWEREVSRYSGSIASQHTAFRTLMMLMDQSEYRMVKALEGSGVVPRIYGTCGPMYLQESCPPGLLDEATLSFREAPSQRVPWGQKAIVLLQLLQLILRLEQDFPQVLHLCDVKGSNFGVCADGSVKLIDADSVFFDSRMMETFHTSQCRTHDDCHFFDCGGWCQTDASRCYMVITNNNLQTLCRDVLSSQLPRVFGGGSLFHNAPPSVAPRLEAVLQQCLDHRSEEKGQWGQIPVNKPPLSLLTTMTRLLEKSLADMDHGL